MALLGAVTLVVGMALGMGATVASDEMTPGGAATFGASEDVGPVPEGSLPEATSPDAPGSEATPPDASEAEPTPPDAPESEASPQDGTGPEPDPPAAPQPAPEPETALPLGGDPPGLHGEIKTHNAGDDPSSEFDRPKVCNLEIVGHDFDADTTFPLRIRTQPGNDLVFGPQLVTTDAGGHFVYPSPPGTGFGLPNTPPTFPYEDQFKVEWDAENDGSYEKSKVFRIECAQEETGEVLVTKVVSGAENVEPGEGWPFVVDVTISHDGEVIFTGTFELTQAAPTVTIPNVPDGAIVTVVETGRGGADATTYSPAASDGESGVLTYEYGGPAAITVTNSFEPPDEENGEVVVTKVVVGADNIGSDEGWPFVVDVTISHDGAVILHETFVLTEAAPTVTIPNVPYGAIVTVVETGRGGADATTYSPAASDGASGVLTYEEYEPATVTVTNRFEADEEVAGESATRPEIRLPFTGSDPIALSTIAIVLMVAGAGLLLVSSRRRPLPQT